MEIIQVQNLNKYYGDKENQIIALKDVSFTVTKGEFVSIIGASGSGKSTLLHILGGIDKPSSGEIIVDGKNINALSNSELSSYRRNIVSLVFQFYNLIPILNVEENISLPTHLDNRVIDSTKIEDLINILGLENKKNKLPNQLSGGEQQRVSIGRALINNSKVLLADEPTGNLDSRNSDEIIKLLKDFNKKYNQTIILVTHNMEIAKQTNRIITLHDGKIIKDEVQ